MMKKIVIGMLVVMGIALSMMPVSASVFTVSPGDSIQAAVTSAASGDTIVLNPGIYSENGISITGKSLTFRAADGHGLLDTIIDGKSAAPRIFTVTDSSSLTIENLALRNGRAGNGANARGGTGDAGSPGSDGGAIFSYGPITIISSSLTGFSAGNGGSGDDGVWGTGGNGAAGGSGGAIFSTGTVTLTSTTISHCSAGSGGNGGDSYQYNYLTDGGRGGSGGRGGAVVSGGITMTSSTIADCSAGSGGQGGDGSSEDTYHGDGGRGGSGGYGGALFSLGSISLTGSTITRCSAGNGGWGGSGSSSGSPGDAGAPGSGGAMYAPWSTVTLIGSTISHCSAGTTGSGGSGGNGGAIYASDGTVILVGSTITDCSAGNGSGGREDQAGGPGGNGGAIYSTGPVTLESSLISRCSAGTGGTGGAGNWHAASAGGTGGNGGAIWAPWVNLTSSTLSDCRAGTGGYGGRGQASIYNEGDAGPGGNGGAGGAVYATGSVTVTGTSVSRCSAGSAGNGGEGNYSGEGGNGGNGGSGGALSAPDVSVRFSTVDGCTGGSAGGGGGGGWLFGGDGSPGSSGNGGGMYTAAGPVTIADSRFTGCGTGGDGGVIYANAGTVTADRSAFSWFAASRNGGAIYSNDEVLVNNSTFALGGAGGNGGAIYANAGVTVSSSLFEGIMARDGDGGAIYANWVVADKSTFYACQAGTNGGAISTWFYTGATSSEFTKCRAVSGSAVFVKAAIFQESTINYNRLTGNTVPVISSTGETADARYNWWGSNSDPSPQVSSGVSADPWMVLGITATPPPLTSQDYAIEANLTVDSAGARHDPAVGHVPDGIPVSFGVVSGSGTISPASAATGAGTAKATFTSTHPGTAMVRATVDSQTVSALIGRPVAEFTALDRSVVRQLQPAQFVDQSDSMLPLTTAWDFGDGSMSDEQDPSHIYQKEGAYTVSLTVSNSMGHDTDTKVDYIFATAPNPLKANFIAVNKAGKAPLEVQFTDRSTVSADIPSYPAINSWLWDFGDGSMSDEQDPSHIYQSPGVYSVTLTVSNGLDNDAKTKEEFITVTTGKPVTKPDKVKNTAHIQLR